MRMGAPCQLWWVLLPVPWEVEEEEEVVEVQPQSLWLLELVEGVLEVQQVL